eukprot:COSAG06_NODE_43712_length_369_cov_1.477778_1_plen_71_part_01
MGSDDVGSSCSTRFSAAIEHSARTRLGVCPLLYKIRPYFYVICCQDDMRLLYCIFQGASDESFAIGNVRLA